MRKLLFFILSIVSINLFAQKAKVNSAKYALETGDVKGKKLIDEAVANPEGALMAKAWMTKGDVYILLFIQLKFCLLLFPTALFDAEEAYKRDMI
ncbi:MAG: hypothetical protein IPO64_16800 [Bacteroidetes bacterium]|nr:hypothetical protein [Bacteroidota bacterium]